LTRLAEGCIFGAMQKRSWMEKASCRGVDTDIFMPSGRGPFDPVKKELALSYCNTCPVKAECVEYALSFDITVGIYGGLTQNDRRRLRKESNEVSD